MFYVIPLIIIVELLWIPFKRVQCNLQSPGKTALIACPSKFVGSIVTFFGDSTAVCAR